ncbi:MAG TPA: SatD family protein [Candidatus Acidoferrum sp.]|nr:SatD family protein [Candidatus Acidoferrum sp.]
MPEEIYAVLIADIVTSTARKDVRALLGKKLAAASEKHLRQKLIRLPYSVTAGDEFQTITGELAPLPALILELRSALRPLSLRVGIGIGSISGRVQPPVNQLTGEAFQLARRAIESIKHGKLFKFDVLTGFASGNEGFDETINLIYGLHDTLLLQITSKQWEAIGAFLSRDTLAPTARRLRVDISTVSRNLKRGYYWQLAETVNRAGSFIERAFC